MTPLEDMSIGNRIALTVVIVLVILFLLAAFGYFTGRWDEADAQIVASSKWDDRLIELDKQALEQAYLEQMGHVFSIWLKDGVTDPSRARVGFGNARKGYGAAMTEIEKRERK
jgi:hypothetical protein